MHLLERKLVTVMPTNNHNGSRSQPPKQPTNQSTVAPTPIYDASNPCHTEKKLVKRASVSQRSLRFARCVSFCCLDNTKIGTDYSANIACIMNSATEETCDALPQVNEFM